MRLLLGIIGMLAGVILGIYVGAWVCFIGGIVGLVNAVVALVGGKVLAGLIAWSIAKIVFAGLAGWISFAVLFIPSYALVASA